MEPLLPGVDGKGEDVVEVVDDADDEGDAGEDEEKCPERSPSGTLSQLQVVKTVGRSP